MSGMMGPFFVTSALGLLEYMPVFDCEIDGVWVANCTKTQICGDGHTAIVPYKIDYSEHTSFYNWVGPFNLVCAGPLHMGMIGSAILLGWASTVWFVPYLSTKYGRKGIFTISCTIEVGTLAMLLYWCSSLLQAILLMLFLGMSTSGRLSVGFAYMSEFLTPDWRVYFSCAFYVLNGMAGLLSVLYFDYVDASYKYITSASLFFLGFSVVGMLTFVQESPLWQMKQIGKQDLAKTTLRKMVREADHGMIDDIVDKSSSETYTGNENIKIVIPRTVQLKEDTKAYKIECTEEEENDMGWYLKQRDIVINLLVFGYVWSGTVFAFFNLNFHIKFLPGKVFGNYLCADISNIVSSCISVALIRRLGRRTTFTINFIIALTGSICIFTAQMPETRVNPHYWMPTFVLISKFGISGNFVNLYVSTVACFPTQFMVVALGICNFWSRLIPSLAPQVAERPQPIPMVIEMSVLLSLIIAV